jgi:hypothetical protein
VNHADEIHSLVQYSFPFFSHTNLTFFFLLRFTFSEGAPDIFSFDRCQVVILMLLIFCDAFLLVVNNQLERSRIHERSPLGPLNFLLLLLAGGAYLF